VLRRIASSILVWFAGEVSAATGATAEELLGVPDVRQYMADDSGGIAWVEAAGGTENLYAAHPPRYQREQLTHQTSEDSTSLQLAAVSRDGGSVLFFSGGLPNGAGETPNPHGFPDAQERTLWLLSTRDGSKHRIDGGPGFAVRAATLSNDGARVIYARGVDVFSAAAGGSPTRLFTARGSLSAFTFSPRGDRLAFVSDRSRYGRGDYAWIGVFDERTRRITYLAPGLGLDSAPAWSPDGRQVAFVRSAVEPRAWRFSDERNGPSFSVMVADAATGTGRAAWASPPGYGARFYGFDLNGFLGPRGVRDVLWMGKDHLVFPAEITGWRLLYAVPASGGEARPLVNGRLEVDGASASADGSRICFAASSPEDPHRTHLYEVSIADELRVRAVTSGRGVERDVECAPAGGSLFYRQAGPATPERLIGRRPDGSEVPLSTAPSARLATAAATGEVITFNAPDGLQISAVLYRPPGHASKGSLPAIVHAHGGSRQKVYPVWETGFGYPTVLRYLMGKGFVVLTVNYRSGTGYGLDFRDPPSYGGRGAGDVQDFIAAAAWLKEHVPEVDPARLAIYGHSYGGHIVSNVLARSDVFRAGIDSAGVEDWVAEMEGDSGAPLPLTIPQRLQAEQLAYDSSAISVIDHWGSEPLLLLHGDDDGSAAMSQSMELYYALQRRGIPVEALILPGEQHAIQTREHQLAYLRAIGDFLDRRLR